LSPNTSPSLRAPLDASAAAREPETIAVWGHFHGGNLGDELVVSTLLDAIRKRRPAARLTAISMAPRETERRHGVPSFAINPGRPAGSRMSPAPAGRERPRGRARRLLRRVPAAHRLLAVVALAKRVVSELPFDVRSYRLLRGVDTIVVAGSGQLLDAWHGPWEHPLTTFRWSVLARLAKTRLVIPAVGAGPIESSLSATMIRHAVNGSAFISVRDAHSEQVLRSIGVTRPLPFCPDMGWGFGLPAPRRPPQGDGPSRVGVNVMSHQDPRYWPRAKPGRYDAYLEKMTAFVARLLDDHEVILFSSQTRADRLVAHDLLERLGERGLAEHPHLASRADAIEEVQDLVDTVAACDYVAAARFHSVLLPLALGIPTVGLAYHAKTRALFDQIGEPQQCLDINTFQSDELYDALQRLRSHDGSEARTKLRERAESLAAAVAAQFDELFGAV
jgi:polysaccharide pyruvyl transferase WcaK-like protein